MFSVGSLGFKADKMARLYREWGLSRDEAIALATTMIRTYNQRKSIWFSKLEETEVCGLTVD